MESYPKLKRSLLGTAMAQVLCEIADQAQDDPACFTLLDGALTDMEQSGDLYSAPLRVYQPHVCAGRHRPDGGWLCALRPQG